MRGIFFFFFFFFLIKRSHQPVNESVNEYSQQVSIPADVCFLNLQQWGGLSEASKSRGGGGFQKQFYLNWVVSEVSAFNV